MSTSSVAKKYLCRLLLKIHPDRYADLPHVRRENSDSVQTLIQLFAWTRTPAGRREQKRTRAVTVDVHVRGAGAREPPRRLAARFGDADGAGGSKELITRQLLALCERARVPVDAEDAAAVGAAAADDSGPVGFGAAARLPPSPPFAALLRHTAGGRQPVAPPLPLGGVLYHKSLSAAQRETFEATVAQFAAPLRDVTPAGVWANRAHVLLVSAEYDWSGREFARDRLLVVPWNWAGGAGSEPDLRRSSALGLWQRYWALCARDLGSGVSFP